VVEPTSRVSVVQPLGPTQPSILSRPDRRHRLSDVQKTTISLLFELIRLRDNYFVFSGDFNFNHSDFLTLINYVSSVYASQYLMYTVTCTCVFLVCITVRVS